MKNRNKKKILFILHLPPPVHGSAVVGQYLQNSVLINNSFKCKYINLSTSRNLDEIGIVSIITFIMFINVIFNVIREIFLFKPDMFYMAPTVKGKGFYKDFLIILILKLRGIKVLYHLHNKGVASRQNRFIDNIFYKIAFNKSFCILLSPLLYSDIQKYIPKSRVSFCAYGIPDYNYLGKSKKVNEICQILFLSNMMKEKGVYTLLEASKILHNKGVIFITYFVGPWFDINEKDFNAFVLLNNLQNNVYYIGAKYGEEKFNCFENSDIFVFPTYYHNETFGLVNLEAMQCGLPVISTREGGIPDIVDDGKTGFLVNKNDPKDLADKIELLINNPFIRHQMGKEAKIKFQNNYTISKFENNMFNILKEIAN